MVFAYPLVDLIILPVQNRDSPPVSTAKPIVITTRTDTAAHFPVNRCQYTAPEHTFAWCHPVAASDMLA